MTLTDLSPPPGAAVSLDAAKVFLRIDHADEDALITDLIDAATRQVEDRCGVTLITRPQRYTRETPARTDKGPGIYLTRSPLLSIEALEQNEISLPIDANLRARPVFLCTGSVGVVTVDFTAGYGLTPADIPTPLRQGVLLLLAHLYEHRAGNIPGGFPMMVDALIQPYRGMRL